MNSSQNDSGNLQQPTKKLTSWKIPKKTQNSSPSTSGRVLERPSSNREKSITSSVATSSKNPNEAINSNKHSKCSNMPLKRPALISLEIEPQAKIVENNSVKCEQNTEKDTNIPYYNSYKFWTPLSNLPTLPDDWKIGRSNSRKNRVYFYNPFSNEKTWECPFKESQLIKLFNRDDPRLKYILTLKHETKTQQNSNISKVPEINSDDTRKRNESISSIFPSGIPSSEEKCNTQESCDSGNGALKVEIINEGLKGTHEQELNDVSPMEWEEIDEIVNQEQSEVEEMDTSQSWFIVVDTNVILKSPSFLNTLKTIYSKDHGESRVIMPWVVLGELDNLKQKESTRKGAIVATRFLRTHVFENEDPRIIGQTFIDHQSLSVPHNAVNDDYILATCVQISKSGMVTLLTNDVNLAVKAKIHKIDVKTSEEMKRYIEDRCEYNRDGEETKEAAKGNNKPIKNAKMNGDEEILSLEDENLIMNRLLPELKQHLCTFVSRVVEKGMENTFRDSWEKHCIRQPPWKLDDCLLCLRQHWISIADNMDVPKINELRALFNKHRKGLKLTWSEIRTALYLCLCLVNSLPVEYSNMVDEFKCYFRDCQRKVNLILSKTTT